MAEQLSFRLEPALPRLPDLRPMRATPGGEPFDSRAHLFEPSWGGRRVLALVGPAARPGTGDVRLLDEDGEDVAPLLPEVAGLAVRVAARSAILDGELVVVDGHGRPDPEALAARLAGGRGRPVAYLVNDLLHVDGRSLLRLPLSKRRAELRRVVRAGDEVVVVPAIAGEGRALCAAVAAQGIPGVLAREAASPYLPGVTSRLWRAIDPTAGGEAATPAAAGEPAAAIDAPATAPVLALFRRLPLEEGEPGEG